ncbi:MAG: anion permease [Simkaniaceae bacterium]|nr:anion permease [Simkaniaceae bacterium]
MQQSIKKKVITLSISAIIGLIIWFIPPPEGLDLQAMHLLALFVFTILGVITKPFPMGLIALLGMTLIAATKTLTLSEALSGFNHSVVWLVVAAFFIARGFIKTGLGERVAYLLMSVLGKNSLGMGYGMVLTDLVLAPVLPSLTARVGGIINPVVLALSKAFGSEPYSHPRKLGAFLVQVAFQGSVITSAMFLTAMAGNPLIADIARSVGVEITWGKWALAAIVPGLLSLITIPYVLYRIYPPELKETPHAKEISKKRLKELGKVKGAEAIMIFSFIILLGLWIMGPVIGMTATVAALLGLMVLLLTNVLTWDEVLKEKGAWNTLIWFSVLIMMATYLNKLGLTTWFSQWIVGNIQGLHWIPAFGIIALVYFYSHYFFASNVAHLSSMFPPFLFLAVSLGTPPLLAALTLGFFSNLFGGLTHYGCGPAPILFGSGYVKITDWWRLGFISSVVNIIIWLLIGGAWWKFLGYF